MKFFTLLLVTASLCSFTQAQTFEWVNTVPLDIQTNPAYLHCPAVLDGYGNPVSARLFNYKELYGTAYYGDVKIEKRNSAGALVWEDTVYGKADVAKLIVDGENNIIGYGTFIDTMQIDTASLIYNGQGTGSFIFKLDSTGNLAWLKDGADYITGYGVLCALAPSGLSNILLGTSDYPVESRLLKLDANGSQVSAIEETNVGTISDIKTDISGNIWATGFAFQGPVSFNGLDTTAPFVYTEYVVKYNSSGNAQWVDFIQDVTVQQFQIETDSSGNAYLGGNLLDSTSFGNLHANGPEWVYDFFVTKLDPDGNFIWLNEIPPGNPLGDAYIGNDNFLSCSKDGHTYLTGTFRGTINFGDSITISPIDYSDLFIISYNQYGEVQWAKSAGSDSYDQGSSVTADESGNYYLSGLVSENFVFDTISGTGEYYNLFLAKLVSDNVVSVENGKGSLPSNFTLMQNYPNPFNPSTKIEYSIPVSGFVSLKVFDVLGKETATLVNEYKTAGNYEVNFNASNLPDGKTDLPSGVYFYRLKSGSAVQIKKMILIK